MQDAIQSPHGKETSHVCCMHVAWTVAPNAHTCANRAQDGQPSLNGTIPRCLPDVYRTNVLTHIIIVP